MDASCVGCQTWITESGVRVSWRRRARASGSTPSTSYRYAAFFAAYLTGLAAGGTVTSTLVGGLTVAVVTTMRRHGPNPGYGTSSAASSSAAPWR